jgi:protein TonB
MSLAPKLVIIEGGLTAEEPPVIPPAGDADRLYLPATPTRAGDFAHLVAVSLTIHAAILAGCLAWSVFGEERASGGTEELVVIEGVDVVMLDQLPSAPSPLVEAAEIETDDEAPVEETELAAVAPEVTIPPTEDVAETPPDPAETAADEARPTVEALATPDHVVEPAPTPAAETPPVAPPDEAHEVAEATVPAAGTSEVPAAKTEAATPVPEDKPAARTEDLSVAADDAATPIDEDTVAAVEDLPASADEAPAPVEDPLAAALPTEDRQEAVADARAAAKDEPTKPAEAPPATDLVKDDALAPEPLRDEPVRPADAETKVAKAAEEAVKPVEETKQAAVAPSPEPPPLAKAEPPKVEKKPPVTPTRKAEKKKQIASAASPSAAASQKTPTARGPTKTKEKAGAGGKSSTAQGKANSSNYRAKIIAHMRRYQRYRPAAGAKVLTGTAVIRITIGRGGRLVETSLVRSSGHTTLDMQALAIARRASPYPPIPAGMSAQVTIQTPMRFGAAP